MRDTLVELECTEHGRVMVAAIEGEVDASNAAELRMAITERLPTTSNALVLDLSRVTYLDSSGVHLLFELANRLAARRQQLRTVAPAAAPIRRVLEMCNVPAVTPLDATAAEALEAATASESG